MKAPSNKEIIRYLSSKNVNSGWTDKLKVRYRPFICPFDKLLSFALDSASVFDIGCGSGQFCSLAARFTQATRIHGVEVSDSLVQNARMVNAEFNGKKEMLFEQYNGVRLPERMREFDTVFLVDVIHHLPPERREPFIFEISKKMGSDSKLVLKDIDAAHPFVIFNKIHDMVFSGETGNELTRKAARQLVERAGLKIEQDFAQTVLVYPHYFLVARK